MTGMQMFLSFLMVCICGFLVLVILIQRGRGSGLAGAFGGGGGSAAFGAKTGDVLTWITVAIAMVFLCLAVTLNFVLDPTAGSTADSALAIESVSLDDVTPPPAPGSESAPLDATGLLSDTPAGQPADGAVGTSSEGKPEPLDAAGSGSPDKPSP